MAVVAGRTARIPSAAELGTEARLIVSWARRELHGTYRQSSLRLVWTVVQPLSVYAVYVVVFHWILKISDDELPYLSFMVVGLTLWRYFAVAFTKATAIVDNAGMLSRVYFRREIIPMSGCTAALIDLGIGTVAMFLLAFAQGIRPTVTVVALPVVYVALILYTVGAAVLLSTVTVFARDLGHAMPTISQLLFLATPVMYPASQVPENLQFLQTLNPIAQLLEAARLCVLAGQWPDGVALAVNLVLSAAFAATCISYLRSIEHRIVDVV